MAEVRFRIVAVLVDSKLELGHRHHGEVNENEWMYFSFNVEDIRTANDFSGHRRLAAVKHRQLQALSDIKQRALSSNADTTNRSVDSHGPTAVHLTIRLWKYSGALFLRPAHGRIFL